MDHNEIVRVENVTKRYGKQLALNSISFSIKKGEIVGLVGPNGAGKSTIMSILVGLIRNYEGNVYIDNHNIREKSSSTTKQVGCVIENPGFYPNLTGYQNLLFFAEVAGGVNRDEIDKIVEMIGLKSALNKKVRKYSLGMKQRLGIAQAVLGFPKLLILDEPTNGLDPNVIPEIRKFIKYVAGEKEISVLISSHILSEIEAICEKVLFIQNGAILKELSLDSRGKNSETSLYVFESNDTSRLISLFKSKGIVIISHDDKSIKVKLGNYSIDSILHEIIESQISIKSMYEYKQTLEEEFLKTMGGNSIE